MGKNFTGLNRAFATLGFADFKSVDQERTVTNTLQGKDVLAIMPTGGGKSACFIIPTLMRGWLTVVISPLKALIDNQVMQNRLNGIPCHALHGGISDDEKMEVALEAKLRRNTPLLIYTTPETASTNWFQKYFGKAAVDLLAIDEVHCVSYWGETFRPDYLRLSEIARKLQVKQIGAYTATADSRFIENIRTFVPFGKTGNELAQIISDPFRPNLRFVKETPGSTEKSIAERNRVAISRLKQVLEQRDEFHGPTLVYCATRKMTTELMQLLAKPLARSGYTPLQYHAGMPNDDKQLALELFLQRPKPVVFCTIAFGMGIDRADVRRVVHIDVPNNLVEYAQECGRAGRDGLPSLCLLFFDSRRLESFESRVKFEIPQAKFVEWVYRSLAKKWLELQPEQRSKYSLSQFTSSIERVRVQSGESEKSVRRYVQSINMSLVALRRAGVVQEDESGFRIKKMTPGSESYLRMLNHTMMAERWQAREYQRVRQYCASGELDQRTLWDLIFDQQ